MRSDKNPIKNFMKAVCGFLSVVVELLVAVKLPRPVSSAGALTFAMAMYRSVCRSSLSGQKGAGTLGNLTK